MKLKAQGFTLIEILVVIVVISIVTAVALMTLTRNENRRLENVSNELVQLITLAEEQAILRPAIIGLEFKENKYFFSLYNPLAKVEKKEPRWQLIDDDRDLGSHLIPDDVDLRIKVAGNPLSKESEDAPQIVLSTNGGLTPFTIYVGKAGKDPRFLIRGDADGSVTVEKLS